MSIMTEGEYRYNMLIKTFASAPEPGFESEEQQKTHWGRVWGCSNDVGRLRLVLMHRPGEELKIVDPSKKLPGIGAYTAAIFHLMTHAFFKALLFLSAGSVIHALSGEQDIRKMGGLKDRIPWTHALFLIGTLAIAGRSLRT